MDYIRYSDERGKVDFGWLKSKHTFSFGEYYDKKYMGFQSLRVINQDQIEGGSGFQTHGHSDMEIISYVIDGALEHQDTLGNKTIIRPHEVQRMSAGTGIKHSEFNHFKDKTTHFLQIWILPEKKGQPPGYAQKNFEDKYKKKEKLFLVGSQDGRDGSITIGQNVSMYVGLLTDKETVLFETSGIRHTWIQLIHGELSVSGHKLSSGDGLALSKKNKIEIVALKNSEFILFDLV